MGHTRPLPLPPPPQGSGEKDVTSAGACCHQRLAERGRADVPIPTSATSGGPAVRGLAPLFICAGHPNPPAKACSWGGPGFILRGEGGRSSLGGGLGFLEEQSCCLGFQRSGEGGGLDLGTPSPRTAPALPHAAPLRLSPQMKTPWTPPKASLQPLSQQSPGVLLTSPRHVYSHRFSSAQTRFSSVWQEGFIGCFCFNLPPLLPLRRQ